MMPTMCKLQSHVYQFTIRHWLVWLLLPTMLLSGCASTLPPIEKMTPVTSCEATKDNCYHLGRIQFDEYRHNKLKQIEHRSGSYRLPSAPTAHLHPTRTKYSVLLIHGLNDSAFYMDDIAELLHKQGFNVLTILLQGHGTDTKDMLKVTAEQWRSDVTQGLQMASLIGEKILVGGFSLGGALAIDATFRSPNIHGLLLFSPAIKLRSFNTVSSLACAPGLRTFSVETDLQINPVKYKYRFGNGVCQLSRLIKSNLTNSKIQNEKQAIFSEKPHVIAQRLQVPTFIALSYADARISPEAVLDWSSKINAPVTVTTFGVATNNSAPKFLNGGKIIHINNENLPHSFLARRSNQYNGQENPYFDEMGKIITHFMNQHF